MSNRAIIHVDMDAFFASVEQLDDPQLAGYPVIVGGLARRGVVSAASYEARKFGVHSAMPMSQARQRCPDGIYLPVRMERYREISRLVFSCFHEMTPLVEGLSLDEAFLDVTASLKLFGDIESIGLQVKQCIKERTSLTASVGMSTNKLVAKIASDLEKPDGFCHISESQIRTRLASLPLSRLWGIGKKTLPQLQQMGAHTFGDLLQMPDEQLKVLLGNSVLELKRRAAGIDDRPVVATSNEKSIGHEQTYEKDIDSLPEAEKELLRLSDAVCSRLRQHVLKGRTLTLKLREKDFTTHTRSQTFTPATDELDTVYQLSRDLLQMWWQENKSARLRLIGVSLSQLENPQQSSLFEAMVNTDHREIDRITDDVRERFGHGSLKRGRLIK
ncbi:MAG: DNA polymerase IV [Gammaproteobacteria bacterium]|nr:MAG: DNA polymerase IV [Gammaproteobacteria bacterium]